MCHIKTFIDINSKGVHETFVNKVLKQYPTGRYFRIVFPMMTIFVYDNEESFLGELDNVEM